MRRSLIAVTIISIFTAFFVSCYYDSEEALYPEINTSCDTSNVTFSGTVTTMLATNCLMCHSNVNAPRKNTIPLENYDAVAARAANISGAINHNGPFLPMPPDGIKIKACSITQFDIWVRKGKIKN
jgi:hypothetical protein